MGFLSGMVKDMIKESTGYDVRKVTRLVGGKNLMMLAGGAALAGGVASAMQQQGGAGAGGGVPNVDSWDAPRGPAPQAPPVPMAPPIPAPQGAYPQAPPPPQNFQSQPVQPAPSAPPAMPGAPPPLPPVPTAPAEEPELPDALTYAVVRAMVAAGLSDGRLEEREKQLILGRLEESGLPIEQKQQVHRDLVLPPSPDELAAMVNDPAERDVVYRLAGLVVLADGELSDLERSWLDRLAGAYGFDAMHKDALEAEIFA